MSGYAALLKYTPQGLANIKDSPERIKQGRALAEKYGCLGCHSIDGTTKDGPTWKGLYGSRVPLEGGTTVVADDAYIKESILDPGARVVTGFPNFMPSFRGNVSDRDIVDITAYIRTLK